MLFDFVVFTSNSTLAVCMLQTFHDMVSEAFSSVIRYDRCKHVWHPTLARHRYPEHQALLYIMHDKDADISVISILGGGGG